MAKKHVYTLPNGKLAITPDIPDPAFLRKTIWCVYQSALAEMAPTEEARNALLNTHWTPTTPPPPVPVREMEDSQLPPSRADRDAWEEHPGGVRVNEVKAAEIRTRRGLP